MRETRAQRALRITAQQERVREGFKAKRAAERKAQAAEVKRRESGGRHRRG